MSNSIASNRPADNYYLDYFMVMIDTVASRYQDLLNQEDHNFLDSINRTSPPALRLLVRLYMRKGPNFIAEKLNYAEVDNITTALNELSTNELIELDPDVYAWELIDILPVATSRELFLEGEEKLKKAELFELWLDDDQLLKASEWECHESIITPANYESLRRFQLLYFGNDRQTITDFILDDLGVAKYEAYTLDTENRLFSTPKDIESFITITDYNNEFYLRQVAKDWGDLVNFSEQCFALEVSSQLSYRWHKLINRVAYRLELEDELEIAFKLFSSNELPLSRERRVRILYKQERYQAAHKLLKSILQQPKATSEITFYQRFINKVNKKLGFPPEKRPKNQWQEQHIKLTKENKAVELIACDYFEHSHWLENALPMGVFGLCHWSVIFDDVPGVWHHPFQSAPADLYEEDFTLKREAQINTLLALNKQQLRKKIITIWQTKYGIANPFIQWKALDLDTVLSCYDALSMMQWQGIFKHILTDIRQHQSGFPDLFQCTESHYQFIEIKGPGDKLQDNQITWLSVFNQLGINVSVCYITYH